MTTAIDPRNSARGDGAIVNYDEPPVKPPPSLAVGPLAWMRENLFKSAFDTVVTVVSAVVLVAAVVGLVRWAISAANWFVITNNLRLFLIGTFPAESLWRLEWAARLCAFVVGVTLLAYTRVSRALMIVMAAILVVLFAVPVIINLTVPPVTAFVAAGDADIVSGTVTEVPQDNLAFLARAGETLTVQIANVGGSTDQPLASVAGFTDRATTALVNAAINRLGTVQELQAAQNRLQTGLITDAQRADLQDEIDSIRIPDPIQETYAINSAPVTVALLDGATGEPLASATLTADSPPLTFTAANDGWYVLQKTSESTALLATTGIYPLRVRNLTRPLDRGGSVQVSQYVRLIDNYETEAPQPEIDGDEPPLMLMVDNQYQGARPFGDFLRMFIAPLFRDLSLPALQLAIAGVLGYGFGIGLMRVLPPTGDTRGDPRKRVRGVVTWLWLAYLLALFVLAYGIANLSALGVGLLLSRFVWVGWMYFTGMNIDHPWGRPLLALVTVLGVAQTVIAEGLIDKLSRGDGSGIAGAIIAVVVWLAVGWYAAGMGRARVAQWKAPARLRGLIGAAVIWLLLFIVPPLLLSVTAAPTENVLPITDTRRWGGFMLTALLTIVSIIASFPLGVLLALGRRSALPVVRWTSVVYIELIRGVPLITVLFMAQLLVPLVNPSLAEIDNVFRAMVGLTLFSSAYLAENVRGGLQSIPHGQEEAAKALGLSGWQVTTLITLPQALRAVIPALVGQAISLFKDTSLVALVGLIDLTGISRGVISQAEYVSLQTEAYLFISVIYFVFSYLMAWVSRRIESSGSGAARRV